MNEIVNSGAGTGKTTYMRNTIKKYLERENTSQSDILGVTFTNRAGANMKRGLQQFPDVEICSLHSYLHSKVLYKDIIPQDIYAHIIDDALFVLNRDKSKYNKLNKIAFESYINSWHSYCIMLTNRANIQSYEQLRNILVDKAYTVDYINKKVANGAVYSELSLIMQQVISVLQRVYSSGYVTFDDIILQGYFLTEEHIKFILVDEFQDFRYIEYLTILNLSSNAQFLLLCDQYQGIYKWRNSNFDYNLKHFKNKFPDTKEVNLGVNYRCSRKVTQLSSLFSGRDNISVNRDIEGAIQVLPGTNYLKGILEKVSSLEDDKNIAILCQSNVECGTVANFLKLNDIKNIDHKVRDFHSECEPVRIFLKVLSYLDSPHNTSYLKSLMADSYFTSKFNMTVPEVLSLLKDITSEQIQFGDYSIFKQHPYNYIVFDTETTGLDTEKDDIIQISAQKLDNNFNVIGEFDQYIYTDKDLSLTQEVHNISNEFIKQHGRNATEVISEFMDFCKDCIMVGHNVGYDKSILLNTASKLSIQPTVSWYIDTLDLARVCMPNKVSYKLGDLNEELNLGCTPNHNSKYDVEATVALLKHIATTAKPKELNKYVVNYYNEVVKYYMEWYDADLLTMYKNIVNSFSLDERQFLFSELFHINLKMVLTKYKDLRKIVNFFTLNDELDLDTSKVTVCTIHQSKGLEFDKVCYVQAFNSNQKLNGDEKTNTDYVAITRARDEFYIFQRCRKSNIADAIRELNNYNQQLKLDTVQQTEKIKSF